MAVKFVDNSDIILKKVADNCKAAMDAVADMLVEAVQMQMLYGYSDLHGSPPHTEIVDTGATFDSVDAEVTKASQNAFSVSVGVGTSYAGYVHNGTRFLKGRPFITDAVLDKKDEIESILSGEIPKGIAD